ncbi:unnamed protein product [Ilex paraguariensis]|uniref:Uncharacterized protein n=1 Tax=Ilex paraguariensis TaxID=185542 RepID=A0ABC8SWA3_9AQUA
MASLPSGSWSSESDPHAVLFPFMSKGHTIPLLHLARLLLYRRIAVTIFTTPANRPFISNSLSDTTASVIDLPFPQNIDGIPAGIESTDKLPSMSLFVSLATATKQMKPRFEKALETLPHITFIISDGFLGWTLDSATKFGVPRLVYYGMSNFAMTMSRFVVENRLLFEKESADELFTVTKFPWIKLTRNDFEPPFTDPEPKGPHSEFILDSVISTSKSYGLVMNSFYELEQLVDARLTLLPKEEFFKNGSSINRVPLQICSALVFKVKNLTLTKLIVHGVMGTTQITLGCILYFRFKAIRP